MRLAHFITHKDSSIKMAVFALILTMVCLLSSQAGEAQISVSDSVIHFQAGTRPIVNVAVRNSSDSALFVSTVLERSADPGMADSKMVLDDSILVSPKKFSVPAKGERTVRLLLKKPLMETEQLFTLTFAPQEKEFDEDESQKIQVKGRGINLRILSGMAALVFVDPARPNPDLKWTREPGKVVFKNDGNQHVRILFAKACRKDTEGAEECVPSEAKRVYSGKTHEVALADDATLTFSRKNGASGDLEAIEIPPLSAK